MIDDKPLTSSMISNQVWQLYHTDRKAFVVRVREHFALGYPGWRIVRVDPELQMILLKDER